ncbi:MAG: MarR family transcriptional regulator [Alphaproteobacteria bacterium TMED89]|nr:MarR family transcriptional regulator [Rhodospirillaceae bacterium]RPH12510.1 MAG: MarR family transcriptional regulator [Alphaproteobacteria bacterium TMED89]
MDGPLSDLPTSLASPAAPPLDSAAREAIELMFFAYRDFTDVADRILEDHDLGRAHHRALYFIGTNGGITVGHLLEILNITKQSLARVLRRLIDSGLVTQRVGASDRRQRLLLVSAQGQTLLDELIEAQRVLLVRAFEHADPASLSGFRQVMLSIMTEEDRQRFEPLLPPESTKTTRAA